MTRNVVLFSTLSAATKFAESRGKTEIIETFRGLWLVHPRPAGIDTCWKEGFTVVLKGKCEVSWLNQE